MTMTVREMAEWLLTFEDQDAIVQVIDHDTYGSYYEQGGTCRVVDFDPVDHVDYDGVYNTRPTVLFGRSE